MKGDVLLVQQPNSTSQIRAYATRQISAETTNLTVLLINLNTYTVLVQLDNTSANYPDHGIVCLTQTEYHVNAENGVLSSTGTPLLNGDDGFQIDTSGFPVLPLSGKLVKCGSTVSLTPYSYTFVSLSSG